MALPQLSTGQHTAVDARQTYRFKISLQEEEVTVVSFKKLVRERLQHDGGATSPALVGGEPQSPGDEPAVPLALPPSNTARDLADGLPPPANRFSSVIERIERYYTGQESEEEEDNPTSEGRVRQEAILRQRHKEEDQYDTDDSFIDDHDLDAYFSDQGEPEHQGFVVTKGALKPRPPRVEGSAADVTLPKKKRPRLQAAEGKAELERKPKGKKMEAGRGGGKGVPVNKGRAKERVKPEGPSKKAKVLGEKPGTALAGVGKKVTEGTFRGSGQAEEVAALVLPVVSAPPTAGVAEHSVAGDASKGPAQSEGPEAAAVAPTAVGGGTKKSGKKQLLSDKVQRALQVSKEREDAAAAAKREADAKRAAKKKGEKQKAKKAAEGDSIQAEGTDAQGSLLSATVSGVPIGLLNAEVSNARTPGMRPDSKKRVRLEEDSCADTQDTVGEAVKKVKVEAGEGAGEEGQAGKVRKPRATDSERLDSAIEELAASVAELCPPAIGGDAEEGGAGGEEGDDAAKKKRLPQHTQAALSKIAKVAGMRKGHIPPELYPRLLPIVGHVLKEASLKMNLKRALAKALDAKKGGAVTPKKEPAKRATGGTPRRKEEGGKRRGEAVGERDLGSGAASPSERVGPSETASPKQIGGQLSTQRLSAALQVLEGHIRQRMQSGSGGAVPGSTSSPVGGGGEGAFQWDHATENALLAVVRAAKEGTGEQNGQAMKALYQELTQLWPSGIMDVGPLQKAIRRAKARVENKVAGEPGRAGAGGSAKRRKDADGAEDLIRKETLERNDGAAEGTPRDQGGQSGMPSGLEGVDQELAVIVEEQGDPGGPTSTEAMHSLPTIFRQHQTGPPQPVQ